MEFNIIAMKQRAKGIMKELTLSPFITICVLGLIGVLMYAGILCFSALTENESALVFLLLIIYVITGILNVSYCWYCLAAVREEDPGWKQLFGGFTQIQGKVLAAIVIKMTVIAILCCMGFIPGVFAFYWLRPLEYILKDDQRSSVFSAIKKSVKMMKGHNLEWLKLDLSFMGWYLLEVFTCYLGGVYAAPYIGFTYAEFYDYLKGQYALFGEEADDM